MSLCEGVGKWWPCWVGLGDENGPCVSPRNLISRVAEKGGAGEPTPSEVYWNICDSQGCGCKISHVQKLGEGEGDGCVVKD